jgi:hypothetical protein
MVASLSVKFMLVCGGADEEITTLVPALAPELRKSAGLSLANVAVITNVPIGRLESTIVATDWPGVDVGTTAVDVPNWNACGSPPTM